MEMTNKERLKQQMAFCLEADKEKEIVRQNYISSASRRENDAEHAWHMALMAVILEEYANEPVDLLKTISMILIHDVVEIDAGDTYAYDEDAKKTQAEREEKAARRIFGLLPEDQAQKMTDLFHEFEEGKTPEARFARTLDNLQPVMLNDASGGLGWTEKNIFISQAIPRQKRTPLGSRILWDEVARPILQKNIDLDNIHGDVSLDLVTDDPQ